MSSGGMHTAVNASSVARDFESLFDPAAQGRAPVKLEFAIFSVCACIGDWELGKP